jgi:hypothetical protein
MITKPHPLGCGFFRAFPKNDKAPQTVICRASCATILVPRARIELALLSEPDFESGASTNSTTEASLTPLKTH